MLTIASESPLQDEIREMIAELNAHMNPLSPPEFQFQMTAEQIDDSDTTLFVARDNQSKVVAIGALKIEDHEMGEVKRMFTRPEVRGTGVGKDILSNIETLARERGLKVLKLETGEAAGFEPAWKLYERNGFAVCGAFLDYPDSGWSRFYVKRLD